MARASYPMKLISWAEVRFSPGPDLAASRFFHGRTADPSQDNHGCRCLPLGTKMDPGSHPWFVIPGWRKIQVDRQGCGYLFALLKH